MSEGLFAAANIFSSLKLVYIFSINPHLGPLQISLGRMMTDILKYFFFHSLVLFAYTAGVNQLMWYYAEMRWEECKALRAEQGCDASGMMLTNIAELCQTPIPEPCSKKYTHFSK